MCLIPSGHVYAHLQLIGLGIVINHVLSLVGNGTGTWPGSGPVLGLGPGAGYRAFGGGLGM